jgi:hypothetical protein
MVCGTEGKGGEGDAELGHGKSKKTRPKKENMVSVSRGRGVPNGRDSFARTPPPTAASIHHPQQRLTAGGRLGSLLLGSVSYPGVLDELCPASVGVLDLEGENKRGGGEKEEGRKQEVKCRLFSAS